MLKIAVIGHPIAHSRSPQIHGAALDSINVEYKYEKHDVKKEDLESFLEYAKSNLDGFNLTMPLKVDVLPYLEGISEEAEKFRSVNTVKVKDGKLYGYNTDSDGYIQSLKNKGGNPSQKRIVILGAGGVVRTIAKKLVECNAESVVILNRTIEKAEEIVKYIGSEKVESGEFLIENITANCKSADVLINATPLGMEGNDGDFEDTSFLQALPDYAIVSDLIYAPPKTKLLKDAEKLGLKIMNGLDMLIFQAIIADEIYLDKKLDLYEVYKSVLNRI